MHSPKPLKAPVVLLLYSLAVFSLLFVWYYFFDKTPDPLPVFHTDWRMSAAILSFIGFFPAIALSALLISFGYGYSDSSSIPRFSIRFLDALKAPLLATLLAAVVYTALFLIATPRLESLRDGLEIKGSLYAQELEKAEDSAAKGDWVESSWHLGVCDRIWPHNKAVSALRDNLKVKLNTKSDIGNATQPVGPEKKQPSLPGPSLPGSTKSLDAASALESARVANAKGSYYDANWYATVALKMAKQGSPEAQLAQRLLSETWAEIEKQSPEQKKGEANPAYLVYRTKRDGYEAVSAQDWIKAFYIFSSLSKTDPKDPDVVKFLKMSTEGLSSITFFRDELDAKHLGTLYRDTLFSLPRADGGRDIVRAGNLYVFRDAAYIDSLEVTRFSSDALPVFTLRCASAKCQPFRFDTASSSMKETVLLLTAIDREKKTESVRPEWTGAKPSGSTSILHLELDFSDVELLAKASERPRELSAAELLDARERLGAFGFVSESFSDSLLQRISDPMLFLAMSVLALAFGWRLRSLRGISFFLVPSILILPFITHAVVQVFRFVSATMVSCSVLVFPFPLAVTAVLAFHLVFMFGALVFLAGQKG